MKRLIKKAVNVDIEEFINDLIYSNEYSNSQVEELINNNTDCIYNGIAYRVFFFYKTSIDELALKYAENRDIEEVCNIIASSLIQINSSYSSFSKTMHGIRTFEKSEKNNDSLSIIIKYNVQNGLDIDKLFNKYSNSFNQETIVRYQNFKDEEEILAKLDNQNFKIVDEEEDEDFYYYVYELINGDPTDF